MNGFLSAVRRYFRTTDLLLLFLGLVTSGFGLVLISSAVKSFGNSRYVLVQLIGIILGVCAYILLTLFDIEHLSFLWKAVFVFNLGLLILPLFFGVGSEQTGNRSWIRFQLGSVETGFQPAELGKILFIFSLAKHFKVLGDDLNTFRGLSQVVLHGAVTTAFVYIFSEDDGMAASYLFIFILMAFAAGLWLRYCALGLMGIVGAVPLLWKYVFGPYQRDRFIVLFDSAYKPDGVGYHQNLSISAIQSGGLHGDGLFDGTITQYGYLPAKQTDFIFTVACEELGFWGGMAIVALLLSIIIACVVAAFRMREDKFSMLVCVGVAAMLTFQTFINIGMNLRLAPVIGLTLPFISYGGTSVVTMFLAIGVVATLKSHYNKRAFIGNSFRD